MNTLYEIYPGYQFITAITQAIPAVMTFLNNHNFTPGEILSFRIPKDFGMYQLNNKQVRVIAITSNTVTLDIDSTGFDAFVYAGTDNEVRQPAMALSSSSGVVPGLYTAEMNLLDSFDNRPLI